MSYVNFRRRKVLLFIGSGPGLFGATIFTTYRGLAPMISPPEGPELHLSELCSCLLVESLGLAVKFPS